VFDIFSNYGTDFNKMMFYKSRFTTGNQFAKETIQHKLNEENMKEEIGETEAQNVI
jgi:hypothetical protein